MEKSNKLGALSNKLVRCISICFFTGGPVRALFKTYETGSANLVVFKNLFENIYRKEILQARLLMVEGKLQKEGEVIHVIVKHCEDWSKLLRTLTSENADHVQVNSLSPRDENDGTPLNEKHNNYGG